MDQAISLDVVLGFLTSTDLFRALDAAELAEVVRIMEVRRRADGERVFREGEPGDGWYVLFAGRARVLKETDSGAWELAVLEPGAAFGEIAILDGEARSATVQALGPVTLFWFGRAPFEQLLEQGSLGAYKLVLAMARMLSRRHRDLTHQVVAFALRDGQPGPASASGQAAGSPTAVTQYLVSE